MDIPTHKIVDGIEIPLTEDEIAKILAEWQANDAIAQAQNQFEQAVVVGFDTGYGWNLPIDDVSRDALSQLRVQILEGINFGIWNDNNACPVDLRGTDNELHSLTIGQVRLLIFQAGNYYSQLLTVLRNSM